MDLWGKMLAVQQEHDDKIVSNVQQMQTDADSAVRNLQTLLAKVHALSCEQQAAVSAAATSERVRLGEAATASGPQGRGAPGRMGLPLPGGPAPLPDASAEPRLCGVGVVFAQVDVRSKGASKDAHGGKPFVSQVVPHGPAEGAIFVEDELLEVRLCSSPALR